ncbi:tetratricopeptide repeat protein [Melghirimyces profundicolus]|uniref:Tetratricopeptide repeat protein n=1 Tax=Melghirimyces profundicolus TaxID=1242148 RepID=A0A2T6BGI3_9BACL|nr:tetratricopeptide repeat protein [Melghirimyces profundicolus]PTX55167.1 tetratricopeptide repeat protein [Melghirimyces profundicolus]
MTGGTAAKVDEVHTDDRALTQIGGNGNAEVDRYWDLARLKVRRKRFSEALAALEELLEADPFHVEGLLLRARVLEEAGRMDEARKAYRKVISGYPEYSPGHREFGRFLLFTEGSPGASETHLMKGLTINPQDAFAHALLAEVYARTGRKQQALLHVEIASRFRTEDIRYFEVCAKVLARLGESTEQVRLLKRTVFSHADNRAAKVRFKRAMRAERREKKNPRAFKRYLQKVLP